MIPPEKEFCVFATWKNTNIHYMWAVQRINGIKTWRVRSINSARSTQFPPLLFLGITYLCRVLTGSEFVFLASETKKWLFRGVLWQYNSVLLVCDKAFVLSLSRFPFFKHGHLACKVFSFLLGKIFPSHISYTYQNTCCCIFRMTRSCSGYQDNRRNKIAHISQ